MRSITAVLGAVSIASTLLALPYGSLPGVSLPSQVNNVATAPTSISPDSTLEASSYYHLNDCESADSSGHNGLSLVSTSQLNGGKAVGIKPEENFTYTPVVIVHGWTGSRDAFGDTADMFASKDDMGLGTKLNDSIIAELKKIPGVAVYTFDYEAHNDTWVTDASIGAKLSKGIQCVYKATGHKVIGVAHSMGGLALRQAMSNKTTALDVRNIYTFDTPNTGGIFRESDATVSGFLSRMAQSTVYGSCIQSYNGMLTAQDEENCYNGAYNEATLNLGTGSTGLKNLKTWDDIRTTENPALTVKSYTGKILVTQPGQILSIYGAVAQTSSTDVGDLVVPEASAETGETTYPTEITCSENLAFISSGTHAQTAYRFTNPENNKVLSPAATACFHGNTYRSSSMVTELAKTISDLVDPFTPNPTYAAWKITGTSVGPIQFGMTLTQAAAFTNNDPTRLDIVNGGIDTGGRVFDPMVNISSVPSTIKGKDVSTFLIYPSLSGFGRSFADMKQLFPTTDEGVGVGSTLTEAKAEFPGLNPKKVKYHEETSIGYTTYQGTKIGFAFYKGYVYSMSLGAGKVLGIDASYLSAYNGSQKIDPNAIEY